MFSKSFSSKKTPQNNKLSTSHTSEEEEKEKLDWSENKKEKQGKKYN